MMLAADLIRDSLSRVLIARATSDYVRISTHCMYPSNATVSVAVRGGASSFVVSDEGGALDEVAGAGFRDRITDRQIRNMVKRQGLKVEKGVIYSPVVSLETLPAAILLVANASKEIADWGLSHLRMTVTRDFKQALTSLLERHFREALKAQKIVGHSNKVHSFSNVVILPKERRLVVDPVVNDPSSIYARLASNLDVKMAGDPNIEQLIVYDDEQEWASSDLKLLQVAAPTVPFSAAEREIMRRAA